MIPFIKTLYWRLSSAFLAVLFIGSVLQFLLFHHLFSKMFDELLQRTQSQLATELAPKITPLLEPVSRYEELRKLALAFLSTNPSVNIYILDDNGRILSDFSRTASSLGRTPIQMAPIHRFIADPAHQELPIYAVDPVRGTPVVFSAAPLTGAPIARFLYITLSNDALWRANQLLYESTVIRGTLLGSGVLLIIVSITGLTVFYLITRRFFDLTRLVRRFADNDFSERFAVTGDDEISEHGRAVNTLADAIVRNMSELRERDRLRKELLSDLSHDLRRPVALISGYSEVLEDPRLGLSEKAADYCQGISRSVEALKRLVEDLFELALLESKEKRAQIGEFLVAELIDELVASFRPKAEDYGITIAEEVTDPDLTATGDLTLIARVLSNLTENALRYTPNGGRIILRALRAPSGVRFELEDTGKGIAEGELPFIFDRTFQGRSVPDRFRGVSGLGLAIVKRIVEAHGSTVEVRSTEGAGTTFSFVLRDSASADTEAPE